MTTSKKFTDFPLDQGLIKALNALGYTEPTEIQSRALPALLGQGKVDFHGQAQTGTGKTLAFGLPLLQSIDKTKNQVQALVVAPTRELVVQIHQSLNALAHYKDINVVAIYGGVSMERQFRDLQKGADIIIGTPGRINDHLRRKTLVLKNLKTIVLDEADIMLDMGFKQEIDDVLGYAPQDRNIWLFSATVKSGISDLLRTHMKNPITVSASKAQVANTNTKQFFCQVPMRYRFEALCRFIDTTDNFYGFIFCQTKMVTGELAEMLIAKGYSANTLHGDMLQGRRNEVIKGFKERRFKILVATDVAARGIDVSDISHVINYGLPDDQESYIHRIGRTGRAGKQGVAVTFIDKRQMYRVNWLEKKYQVSISPIQVPSFEEIVKQRIKEATTYLNTSLEKQGEQATFPEEVHTKALGALVDTYSHDQLKNVLMSVLSDKFLKHILEQKNISFVDQRESSYHGGGQGYERRSRYSSEGSHGSFARRRRPSSGHGRGDGRSGGSRSWSPR